MSTGISKIHRYPRVLIDIQELPGLRPVLRKKLDQHSTGHRGDTGRYVGIIGETVFTAWTTRSTGYSRTHGRPGILDHLVDRQDPLVTQGALADPQNLHLGGDEGG